MSILIVEDNRGQTLPTRVGWTGRLPATSPTCPTPAAGTVTRVTRSPALLSMDGRIQKRKLYRRYGLPLTGVSGNICSTRHKN